MKLLVKATEICDNKHDDSIDSSSTCANADCSWNCWVIE